MKKVIEYIVSWLKKYIKKSKMKGFIVGLSGGIDSSVTSVLTAMTGFNTLVVEIPILKNDNSISKKHINFLFSKFKNVYSINKNLKKVFDIFCKTVKDDHFSIEKKIYKDRYLLSLANVKSRIRMLTLYYYANINNYLVVGTGNKIEDYGIGFFTKYGDGGVDLQPIGDLTKKEIYLIAKEMNIIDDIQNAKPTDGLWEDHRSDEDQIGASYNELEWAMKNYGKMKKIHLSDDKKKIINLYEKLHIKNKHKIISIPVCRIPFNIKK